MDPSRAKMRAQDDEDSDDDLMTIKRHNHDLDHGAEEAVAPAHRKKPVCYISYHPALHKRSE
jgi:hypothetical protein